MSAPPAPATLPQQPGGGLRAYYVAVGSPDAKLDTLVGLLEALRAGSRLAVAVSCSSRDSLDAVVAALAHSGGFNVAVLHSDMEPHDVEQQVLQLKRALQSLPQCAAEGVLQHAAGTQQQQPHAQQPPQQPQPVPVAAAAGSQQPQPTAEQDCRSIGLVTTDVCLKALPKHMLPLGPLLLIQFDLPSTKDVLQRRLGCVFGSTKERSRRGSRLVVIDFVVAGQLAAFRERERMSGLAVQEMPVHVPDVFAQ